MNWRILAYKTKMFSVNNLCMNETCLITQAVRVDTTGKTVVSCAPVETEGNATQQMGRASVPPVGWDSPANKVTLYGCIACLCFLS